MPTTSSREDDGFGEVSYSKPVERRGGSRATTAEPTGAGQAAGNGSRTSYGRSAYGTPQYEAPRRTSAHNGVNGQAATGATRAEYDDGYPLYRDGTPSRAYPGATTTGWRADETEAGTGRAADRRRRRRAERGLPGAAALVILFLICGLGGVIDLISGSSVKGGFNIALVVGALIAIVFVRRSSMFPVVVAPPIIYFLASAVMLYIRSDGLKDRGVMLDVGVNWLVYGFPAIAGATAAVLIIAGIRLVVGK